MSARIEVRIGLVATLLALAALVIACIAPATYSYGTNWLTAGSRSLWDVGLDDAGVLVYLAVLTAAATGLGMSVYLRSRGGGPAALTTMWTSAIVYLAGALATLPGDNTAVVPSVLHTGTPDSVGIGVYLLLPALIGIAVALMATLVHPTESRSGMLRPHVHG